MKRIATLLAALALISTTSGCGCCSWLWPKPHVVAQPICAPTCNTCNTCPAPACGCDSCGCGTTGTGYGVPTGTPYGAGYGAPTVYDGGYSSGYVPQ